MEVIHNSVVSDVITGQACYDVLVVPNVGIKYRPTAASAAGKIA